MDWTFFGVLAVIFFVLAPILGVIAFFRTQRLAREVESLRAAAVMRWELATAPPPRRPQVQQLEAEPAPLEPAAVSRPEPQAEPVPELHYEPHPAMAPYSAPSSTDIEAVIGGKWLNIIGLGAVLVASAFFLKYAFDNNWIGPIV